MLMRHHFYLMAGIVAVLAVMLALTLSLTASQEKKKSIRESISHGANERPVPETRKRAPQNP